MTVNEFWDGEVYAEETGGQAVYYIKLIQYGPIVPVSSFAFPKLIPISQETVHGAD